MDDEGTGTVVVGVDGSPGARAALEFALQEADRRGVRLRVVVAARLPEYWAMASGMVAPPPESEIVAGARGVAREAVDAVLTARPDLASRVAVSVDAVAGEPAQVLLDAADGADVLVVGHRGRGAVRSAAPCMRGMTRIAPLLASQSSSAIQSVTTVIVYASACDARPSCRCVGVRPSSRWMPSERQRRG